MALANSPTTIYCQTCANGWPLDDEGTAHYFRSASFAVGSYTSPSRIATEGEEMTFCPRCDVEELLPEPIPNAPPGVRGIDQFHDGDNKMIDADVDKGKASEGDADVVHEPEQI